MTERARYWSEMLRAWQRSGLSQAEFCRQRGVNAGTFVWWKRQLQKRAGDAPKRRGRPRQFVEVRLAGTPSASMYEVVLPRGRSIRVSPQFDPETLSRLIPVVESC